MFDSIITEIVASSVVGIIAFLTICFFLRPSSLNGEWILTSYIRESDYEPFKNLQIEFKVHLLLQGNAISGRGEKLKEIRHDGTVVVFSPGNRTSFKVSGSYSGLKVFGFKIRMQLEEKGAERTSSVYCQLKLKTKRKLKGVFRSTAANTSGESIWIKVD